VDVIHELLATRDPADKLGARAISIDEAQQLIDNRYVIFTGWSATHPCSRWPCESMERSTESRLMTQPGR
jgi:hypothetical protein